MKNLDVRTEIRRAGFFNYEIASELGLSEQAFSHALTRRELSDNRREEVMQAIEKLKKQREEAAEHGENGTVAES